MRNLHHDSNHKSLSRERERDLDQPLLSITDHLSNNYTINFWKRYFTENCTSVNIENFYEAIY